MFRVRFPSNYSWKEQKWKIELRLEMEMGKEETSLRKGLRPSYSLKQKFSVMFIRHGRDAVSALLNIENGARLLPGESVVSDPWGPCLSEEFVASFATSSSQVEAPSTAASLRRVALAWVPSLAAFHRYLVHS